MAKRTPYQERIIRNYYRNQDSIMLQRLGEMISDLYLAEGKGRERLWERVGGVLKNLRVPPDRIDHLRGSDNPTLVANLLREMLEKG